MGSDSAHSDTESTTLKSKKGENGLTSCGMVQRIVRTGNSRTCLSIMTWLLVLAFAFLVVTASDKAAADDRDGAAILFSNDKGGLTKSERVSIQVAWAQCLAERQEPH